MNQKQNQLSCCSHQNDSGNCRLCGIHMHQGITAYKSVRFESCHEGATKRYLNSLRKRAGKEVPLKEKFEFSQPVYDTVEKLANKFEFGIQTMALGIYLYNLLINKGDKSYRTEDIEFYSSVCLMVAAKAIELDKMVPYFSRYSKYVLKHHSTNEFEKAEKAVIEEFNFQIQKPTFVTFVNFYLTNGIIFSDDDYCNKKVSQIEDKVKDACITVLKNGSFALQNPEKLAANLVLDCRKQAKLCWHRAIQQYSGLSAEDLHRSEVLKPISTHNIPKGYNSVAHDTHTKVTLPRLDKIMREKSTSKTKDRLQFMRGSQTLRSVPSFHSLNVFSFKKPQS